MEDFKLGVHPFGQAQGITDNVGMDFDSINVHYIFLLAFLSNKNICRTVSSSSFSAKEAEADRKSVV